ncbi:MAG: hypothetical protein ACTXOO_05575 [Sodalis sp. (in: enterobacteria)]
MKINTYSDFILTLIDEPYDLTLSEIQAFLKILSALNKPHYFVVLFTAI